MNNGGGDGSPNPVDKFEESFMNCLSSLTKEDTLTNVDKEEIRVDVDQGILAVIEGARAMESYFLKKRLEIATQKPELLIKDDANELRLELIRKDDLLKKNYEKISHWQSILSDVAATTGTGTGSKVPAGAGSGAGGGSLSTVSSGPPSVGMSHPMSVGPHTPHTPQQQGPMTPTGGGRPGTPGSAGRPNTPGRMQSGHM